MVNFWDRLAGRGHENRPVEAKMSGLQTIFSPTGVQASDLLFDDHIGTGTSGYRKNPIVFRCVRMIVEAATSVPLKLGDVLGGANADLAELLQQPNPHQSLAEFTEQIYTHLFNYGNAYIQEVRIEDRPRALFALRPDRVQVEIGADGWPNSFRYKVGENVTQFRANEEGRACVLHLKMFDPGDDIYGYPPLRAANLSLQTHNAAMQWNKELLKNAARPSCALVYSAASGNLTQTQFDRLKSELENGFQGAHNAGRPMVLEGGLDWKSMAMSPRDMDFIEAKNSASRDIALAFGVPPMLLGIPGDNSFANYAEANRSFWRATIVPLVRRTADALSNWMAGDGSVSITPDFEQIEALSEDRNAKWTRIAQADFLSDQEKRTLLGLNTE